ncbi:MAG: beta-galactosidase [Fimbriimonas sp.]
MSPRFQSPVILHGGDYNPEQWPREVWDEDARMMDLANWNVATVGVFSWVTLEPEEGRFEFDWLDEVMDRLHRGGRRAILATPSAAAPAWLSQRYPETRRVGADGVRMRHANRVNYCWTSPVYREKTRAMARKLAERYGDHPALALWHVSNEYGGACHCDLCAEAFRDWLKVKFRGDLDRLNAAYWARFWSHTFTDWSQIEIPGPPHGESSLHGLAIDWRRFVSDQILEFFLNERAPLREITPDVPITTNLMGFYPGVDPWKFAPHLDVISWDSYPGFGGDLADPQTWASVGFAHDLNRSLKGQPFLLMECTPSASNWYEEMSLKRPGMHRLEGMQAVAHGADGVGYFQWRQSRGGQEKFHGGVVAHDGTERTRVFRDVADLGAALAEIPDVAGTPSPPAQAAIVYDWEVAWAIEDAVGPRMKGKDYLLTCRAHYTPFWEAGVAVDVISSDIDLSPYRLVVAPMLYMLKPGVADRIAEFVRNGGTFVTTYWTGIADENDRCFQGGFPGPLREVMGIWSEEIDALREGQTNAVEIAAGNPLGLGGRYEARQLCDLIHAESAEVLATYGEDFYAGRPALTRNRFGAGEAYYVASRNDAAFLRDLLRALVARTGIEPAFDVALPEGVTARKRGEHLFLMNCTGELQALRSPRYGAMVLQPYEVRIVFARRPLEAGELVASGER